MVQQVRWRFQVFPLHGGHPRRNLLRMRCQSRRVRLWPLRMFRSTPEGSSLPRRLRFSHSPPGRAMVFSRPCPRLCQPLRPRLWRLPLRRRLLRHHRPCTRRSRWLGCRLQICRRPVFPPPIPCRPLRPRPCRQPRWGRRFRGLLRVFPVSRLLPSQCRGHTPPGTRLLRDMLRPCRSRAWPLLCRLSV